MRTILQKFLLLIALLIVAGSGIHAEENNISMKENNISMTEKEFNFNKVSRQVTHCDTEQLALIKNNLRYVEIMAYLYAFSLIIITLLILIKRQDCQAKDLVTIIGLVSVIFGIILLVLIVDTTETLTAPMGIFGAIAGYWFGTAQEKKGSGG